MSFFKRPGAQRLLFIVIGGCCKGRGPLAAAVLLLLPVGGLVSSVAPQFEPVATAVAAAAFTPSWLYLERGDLSALRARGKLRVLTLGAADGACRPSTQVDFEQAMLRDLGKRLDLEPTWVCAKRPADLIAHLLAGKGDVIAGHLPVSSDHKKRVAFTLPLFHSREYLITRAGDAPVDDLGELAGARIAVSQLSHSFAHWEWLIGNRAQLGLQLVRGHLSADLLSKALIEGILDGAVLDQHRADSLLENHPELKIAMNVGQRYPIAWAVRPQARELLAALDHFVNATRLAHQQPAIYRADLPEIKQRKVLRVLVRNSNSGYFVRDGEVLGFEYNLVRRFARTHGLHLEVIVTQTDAELFEGLRTGRGDLVAAPVRVSEESYQGVALSRPYRFVRDAIVVHAAHPMPPSSLREASASSILVQRNGSAWETLAELVRAGTALRVVPAAEDVNATDLAVAVAAGEYELAVMDGVAVREAVLGGAPIRVALWLDQRMPRSWAVRQSDGELLNAVNRFIAREYRSAFYNLVHRRHVEAAVHKTEASESIARLSPYDDLTRRFADRYGFDWRLLVAQMYQESRFDPQATSSKGAEGLMQVMPPTARDMGFGNVKDPLKGIHAGVKYMAWMRERFERELPVEQRTWFALAGYNAGYTRVRDARRLAAKLGLDPDRWFGHVERAMLELPRSELAEANGHTSCRCDEPVHYVKAVRARYLAYLRLQQPKFTRYASSHGTRDPARSSAAG
jgi:membrane-bound lytic murein transglycosylase F